MKEYTLVHAPGIDKFCDGKSTIFIYGVRRRALAICKYLMFHGYTVRGFIVPDKARIKEKFIELPEDIPIFTVNAMERAAPDVGVILADINTAGELEALKRIGFIDFLSDFDASAILQEHYCQTVTIPNMMEYYAEEISLILSEEYEKDNPFSEENVKRFMV